jgi:polyisoprenoid-binding protein YceI
VTTDEARGTRDGAPGTKDAQPEGATARAEALRSTSPFVTRPLVAIDAASVDTGNRPGDAHLRNAAFFAVAQHPRLTFGGRTIAPLDAAAGRCRVGGDLAVRGVTRPAMLDVDVDLPEPVARRLVARFSATKQLDGRVFGIVWSHRLALPADEVRVAVSVSAAPAPVAEIAGTHGAVAAV